MRYRSIVSDGVDLQANSLKSADCGLAAGAGALDDYVNFAEAVILSSLCSLLRGNLRSKRRRFTGTLESDVSAGRPRKQSAALVGDAHNGVVERREDVSDTAADILLFLFTG